MNAGSAMGGQLDLLQIMVSLFFQRILGLNEERYEVKL